MAKFETHEPDGERNGAKASDPNSSAQIPAHTERKKRKTTGRTGQIALVTLLGVVVLAAILVLAQHEYGFADRLLVSDSKSAQEHAAGAAGSRSGEGTISGADSTSEKAAESVPSEANETASSPEETLSEAAAEETTPGAGSISEETASESTPSDSSAASNVSVSSYEAPSPDNETPSGSDGSDDTSASASEEAESHPNESTVPAAADTTPPIISGADPVWIAVQADFDVFEGVTVTDDTDPAPTLTADVTHVDTAATGVVTITYAASDASGNSITAERNVHIANELGEYEGETFPIYWDTKGIEGQPYLVTVNRGMNTVTVFGKDEEGNYTVPVKAMVCSVGDNTPDGYYRTQERYRWKELFENSFGQYAIRIVNHILFHSVPYDSMDPATLQTEEYNLLGTSASHGCVRLTTEDAKWLYDNCPNGFPAILYVDTDMPGPLGKPSLATINSEDARATWDPTDPDDANPWKSEE